MIKDSFINLFHFISQASQIRNKPIKNVDPNAQRFIEMQSEITVNKSTKHSDKTFQTLFSIYEKNQNGKEQSYRVMVNP